MESRYYISSLPGDAVQLLEATRNHWRIENSCHWVLDVAFREDASRIRKDNSGENFAIVRRIALNLLKSEKSTKLGVANKRLKAPWDNKLLDYYSLNSILKNQMRFPCRNPPQRLTSLKKRAILG